MREHLLKIIIGMRLLKTQVITTSFVHLNPKTHFVSEINIALRHGLSYSYPTLIVYTNKEDVYIDKWTLIFRLKPRLLTV